MINIYILTLFPELFDAFKDYSIIKKGLQKNAFSLIIKNIRDHAVNRYGQVDDLPYGGGPGMVLRPEPIVDAFESLKIKDTKKVIFFSPKGRKINHNYIINLTKYENIVLICGHYEGVDQRVIDLLIDDELSIGDFVVTGGEVPAMLLIDAAIRHIDNVINKDSLLEESFSNNLLEYKHYTRPYEYKGMKVPDVLISGNHKMIDEYRLYESVKETMLKRSDLIEKNKFDKNIESIINKIREENKNEFIT